MQGYYGGLIIVILYASTAENVVVQDFSLLTQNNQLILTQASEEILVQE